MSATQDSIVLFVYGSLQTGLDGNSLLAGASDLGNTRTAARYTLLWDGTYPALAEGGDTSISGQRFRIPMALLPVLDEYEEAPAIYRRGRVELEEGTECIAYFAVSSAHKRWKPLNHTCWKSFLKESEMRGKA